MAYKEASGILGVKNTCTSYTSSPTYWGFKILCGFSPLKWSSVQFVLSCHRVTKITVNLSIHYFGSYLNTPSKSTNHHRMDSSCNHDSLRRSGCYSDNSESCITKNAFRWCSRSQEQCIFRSDSEFSNASDAVTMQVLPLWKLEVLPLHKKTVKLTQKVTAQNDLDFQKLKLPVPTHQNA